MSVTQQSAAVTVQPESQNNQTASTVLSQPMPQYHEGGSLAMMHNLLAEDGKPVPVTPAPILKPTALQNSVNADTFTDVPVTIQCPYCYIVVTTELDFHATCVGYLLCGLMAFCCECVQDVEHKCPNCHRTVGLFERF